MSWYKVKTDFATLARMRWVEGESTEKLAKFFQVAEDTLKGYLCKLRKYQNLVKLGLEENEMALIYKAIKKEFNDGQSNRVTY